MQPLLASPRTHLTEEFVTDLLQSHRTLQITYGAMGLDDQFAEQADLSDYVTTGSQINSDDTSTIPRTCTLNMDGDVTATGWSYLSGFVRPEMTLIDVATGKSATFHLGVYTLTTPTEVLGSNPSTLSFQGYDLIYLLQQPVGDSYEVLAGSDPALAAADAVAAAIPGVAVTVTPADTTLASPMTWPFDANDSTPTTFLDVVNDLLAAVGYHEVWVDWDGVFRIEPYVDLQETEFEWTFDATSDITVMADGRQRDIDLFTVPNWWRFVQADLTDTPLEGVTMFTYEDNSTANPGSTINRGRTVKHIEAVSVTGYSALLTYAQRVISQDLTPAETFKVTCQPFPIAWRMDVLHYVDPALTDTGERRVVGTSWSLPLDGQSDMTWSWQTVVDQTASLGLAVSTDDLSGDNDADEVTG